MLKPLLVLMAVALGATPARASFNFSIVPITLNPTQGDVGDVFDVVLTNTGPAFQANSFTFEVSTTDGDITFTSADPLNTVDPYIFAGDSFVGSGALNTGSGQTLDASDLTADFADITVPVGAVALGEVFYEVAPAAALGPFTITFGVASANGLSDANFDTITPDSLNSQQFDIEQGVPEPATFGTLMVAFSLLLCAWKSRLRHGRTAAAESSGPFIATTKSPSS
jgi:hypothetical protein